MLLFDILIGLTRVIEEDGSLCIQTAQVDRRRNNYTVNQNLKFSTNNNLILHINDDKFLVGHSGIGFALWLTSRPSAQHHDVTNYMANSQNEGAVRQIG